MRRLSTLLVAIAAVLVVTPRAEAAPITLTVGETLTFNWDLLAEGAIPAPPYRSVTFFSNFISLAPGSSLASTFFGDLNASDPLNSSDGIVTSTFVNFTGFNDGVFSATYRLTSGAATIDPFVRGTTAAGVTTGNIAPLAAVPEPATLTLLATGLAGVASVARRRRKQYVQ